jgi:hypothetical protein
MRNERRERKERREEGGKKEGEEDLQVIFCFTLLFTLKK